MKSYREFTEQLNLQRREATPSEIQHHYRHHTKPSIRHFTREVLHGRSKSGVAHRDSTRAKLIFRDGKVFARLRGQEVELTATHYTMENGKSFVADLRVKSQYLPGH